MSIPPEVTYDRLPPMGYPNSIKIQRFMPTTNSINSPGDIIRFNINTGGYWDPYSAYINLEVDISQESTLDNYDVLQVDSSASSFISELVITCKGGELERITEYDVLANIIDDISLNNEQRQSRDIQGLGNNTRAFNKKIGSLYPDSINTLSRTVTETSGLATSLALSTTKYSIVGPKPWVFPNVDEDDKKTIDLTNCDAFSDSTTDEYRLLQRSMYIHTPGTLTKVNSSVGTGGVCHGIIQNLGGNFSTFYYSNNSGNLSTRSWNNGINGIFDNDLCQGCFEPFFSKEITIGGFKDGYWQPIKPQKRQFCIPLYSGVLGLLMPKSSYKYLPMLALEDLVLEFRLNPYAMFTSGYKPCSGSTWIVSNTDDITKYGQIPRKWKITKFEIVVEMLSFDKNIDNMVTSALNSESGIVFHTTSWFLGPQYSIPAGTTPSGTYQLNLGFESLKTLLIMFIPSDYLKYSFCRKLYRVNCGITSLQLRIGMDVYPSLPIKGHSGTSGAISSDYEYANNNEYLIALYKAFQKFQNKDEDCSINSNNFAVNERYWNPAEVGMFRDGTVKNVASPFSTCAYMPLLWENRVKGKAIFALDLESMSENPKIISGLNTIKNKSLELILTSDANSYYRFNRTTSVSGTSSSCTMYLWCNYDMVVQLKKYGTKIMGKGNSGL